MSAEEGDGKIWLATAALALAMITLSLIIANMGYFQLGDNEPPLGPITNQVAEVLIWVLLFVWICIGILAFLQRGKGQKTRQRRDNPGTGGTLKALISLFVILGLVLAFVYLTQGMVFAPPADPGAGGGDGGGSNQPPVSSNGVGDSMILVGFLIFVVLIAGILSIKFVRRTPISSVSAWQALEQQKAKDIIDKAVRDLYAGDDARSIVIRTYQTMTRLLRGKVEDAEMLTPREIAVLAERRFGWPSKPTEELTSLFEEAWYSDHRLKEENRDAALNCLTQISSQIGNNQAGKG